MQNEYDGRGRDLALNRAFLDDPRAACTAFAPAGELEWVRAAGLTDYLKNPCAPAADEVMTGVLNSLSLPGSLFCFALRGTKDGVGVWYGTQSDNAGTLRSTLRSSLPGIDLGGAGGAVPFAGLPCGGVVTGYPALPRQEAGNQRPTVTDNLCRALQGEDFLLLTAGRRLSASAALQSATCLLRESGDCKKHIHYSANNVMNRISYEETDYGSQDYLNSLEKLTKLVQSGIRCGLWSTTVYYAAPDEEQAERVRAILTAGLTDLEGQRSEPVRAWPFSLMQQRPLPLMPLALPADPIPAGLPYPLCGPAGRLFDLAWQTLLDSRTMTALCSMPCFEVPGFYIDSYVEFDTALRARPKTPVYLGAICRTGRAAQAGTENAYCTEKEDFTRHGLIVGVTGGGKSNTSKSLLSQLWLMQGIPFLVIESAKREYWELLNVDEYSVVPPRADGSRLPLPRSYAGLRVYTLGENGEDSIPYRLNPFECMEGTSLQTHIDYLLATFKASFELFPPMPYVLERAVYEVYEDRGWNILTNANDWGLTRWPTLTDLYYKVDEVVESMHYNDEVKSNVRAALQARINSLRIGGKKRMLDVPRSVPIRTLLDAPAVLELEALGDDETKAFVTGLLMTQLYEYRKVQQLREPHHGLRHVLMIEEAHRLLKNVPETDAVRARSVEFFCNMLAEIRTAGQGILIADQSPTKLAPDTLKNTNLKICHRIVMGEDRRTMGQAMNMTDARTDYLSELPRGCAAVYAEGDNRPKLVKMPLVRDKSHLTRREAIAAVRANLAGQPAGDAGAAPENVHFGCAWCEETECTLRHKIEEYYKTGGGDEIVRAWLKEGFRARGLAVPCIAIARRAGAPALTRAEKICMGGLILRQLKLTDVQRHTAMTEFVRHLCMEEKENDG